MTDTVDALNAALTNAQSAADAYRAKRDAERDSLTLWHDHNRSMHDALSDVRDLKARLEAARKAGSL